MNTIVSLFVYIALFVAIPQTVLADNLQSAKTVSTNTHHSSIGLRLLEHSTHKISFITTQQIVSGSFKIIMPASTTTALSNDGKPDGGSSISHSGFDLNSLTENDITCDIPHVGVVYASIIPSSISKSHEHEIDCSYAGPVASNSLVTITIGTAAHEMINPEKVSSHQKGMADTYGIEIHHLDEQGLLASQITTRVALTPPFDPTVGVGINAIVGESRFSIYGFTSPGALVTVDGQSIHSQTTAETDGYFAFRSLFSPFVKQEVCLIAKDTDNRISQPVCLAPFPIDEDTVIGPILISPTLSINRDGLLVGDKAFLSGQTIPNTELEVSFFTDESSNLQDKLPLVPRAHAYVIPEISTTSDAKGLYEMTIPTDLATRFTLFSIASYQNAKTPKSTTLTISIDPMLLSYIQKLWPLLWLLVAVLAGFYHYMHRRVLHPYNLHNSRILAKRPHYEITTSYPRSISILTRQALEQRY